MQNDDITWGILNRRHCSYKIKTDTKYFCRNEYNVIGLCMRKACPLANSQYATVRENKGVVYLYIRYPENVYTPIKEWKRVRLQKNFVGALQQLEDNLVFWPSYFKSKCRQRFYKITQYLARMRKLELNTSKKLVPIRQKDERRLALNENKALIASKLDTEIEKRLIGRLKDGVYEKIYNFPKVSFESLLEGEIDEKEELEEELEDLEEEARPNKVKVAVGEEETDGEEEHELNDKELEEELDQQLLKLSRDDGLEEDNDDEEDDDDEGDFNDSDLELGTDEEEVEGEEEGVEYVADFSESEDEEEVVDIEDAAEKLAGPSTSLGARKRKRFDPAAGVKQITTKWDKKALEMRSDRKLTKRIYTTNELMKLKKKQQKQRILAFAEKYEKEQEKKRARITLRK